MVEQNVFTALEVSHRAYILSTGRITYEGKASELMDMPDIQERYLGIS